MGEPGLPRQEEVSIPFIAGQWSLPSCRCWRRASQSPSLRGSGRFGSRPRTRYGSIFCFNPLHCGAVVASVGRRALPLPSALCFNPLHCGAVVASPNHPPRGKGGEPVSIPFIAGQWSLHEAYLRHLVWNVVFQSPSLRGSGRFRGARRKKRWILSCFNPLHCGAVVAS